MTKPKIEGANGLFPKAIEWNRSFEKVDFELEDNMSEYGVKFVETVNPNGKGRPVEWPAFYPPDPIFLKLGAHLKVRNIPYWEQMKFLGDFSK